MTGPEKAKVVKRTVDRIAQMLKNCTAEDDPTVSTRWCFYSCDKNLCDNILVWS